MNYILLDVVLTIRAGEFGIFPEAELICWLRAVMDGPGKLLIVEPMKPMEGPGTGLRSYLASESRIETDEITALVERLRAMGYPARGLETREAGDPENSWWAGATLEVTLDDQSRRDEISLGSEGLRGPDAPGLTGIFRALLAMATVESRWSDLLIRHAHEQA
jgi:hypothetical protein